MIAHLCVAVLMQSPIGSRLSRLAAERKAFDQNVVHSKAYEMEENIYSMGPGSQHIYGFYPFGKSDRRYLVADYGGHVRTLLYQAIRKGKPRTLWALDLRDSKVRAPAKGTLAAMLRASYHVEVVGKATRQERQCLASHELLAGYGYDGISRPYAWIVQADGREKPYYSLPSLDTTANYYPILAEEAEALGLGHRSWPSDLRYEVWPPKGGNLLP